MLGIPVHISGSYIWVHGSTANPETPMGIPEQCLIACFFWLHVAFMLYAGCAPACVGPPGTLIGYAVTSFVVGWTSFLLAVTTTTVVPRMHGFKTTMALLPSAGVTVWGALILYRAIDNLPWPSCSISRVLVVGCFFGLQALQLVMFGLSFVLRFMLPQSCENDQSRVAVVESVFISAV